VQGRKDGKIKTRKDRNKNEFNKARKEEKIGNTLKDHNSTILRQNFSNDLRIIIILLIKYCLSIIINAPLGIQI
jgi:hypothetical protein